MHTGDDTPRVGVVGLGYVGLPLALAFTQAGYEVVGVDIDADRVDTLRDGRSYVTDISDEDVEIALAEGFTPTTEYETLSDVDGVSICVPTPLRKTGQPNLSYVADATERLAEVLPDGCTVILESTVYPGATEDLVAPTLSENGKVVGEDVHVAFSPERIDPGREDYALTEIPKVLGGVTPSCGDHAMALYEGVFDKVVRVESSTEAELVKLLENTFRAVNIGLINEIAMIANDLDVDVWQVVEAASTKPYGFMPFYPGPGLGGHCIPIDPLYLSWKAGQQGIETRFIDLADEVNREMPVHVVRQVNELLNEEGLAVSQSSILVVGVAYKSNISDVRESPAYDVIGLLDERGASISYHDPYVPTFEVEEESYESVELTRERLDETDLVLVLTDHDNIDFARLVDESSLVFDTRNATDGIKSESIVRL
ncbi:UDP-glucose/GDP-mannose dehydrogenase [Halorubrum saccharovorum DSM 1137]|uniref:UDP-N-acetyl-D-mannosamine dehydrogenase n=1 Tax=Halorubrum saccharovorum DSM 1137 TaxID=1227484 RepID=M0DKT8_9EURY|nr:nucleotide sugar dehydrogenase [Halorubrum saccharovorum]ELZ36070.1 UDP-glucose/GDP-mannose dehydrogenase [Halorubrum saccharovorum DSM 1137]